MESLKYLCECCKYENCQKEQIVIKEKDKCKIIKCLQYVKDESKIVPPIIEEIEEDDESI